MSQTFQLPGTNDDANQSITSLIPACLESLRSSFAGAVAPSSPALVTGQLWVDTATGYVFVRNGAGSGWTVLGRLNTNAQQQLSTDAVASLSATTTLKLNGAALPGTIKKLYVLCETASTSSSGNEWQFQLAKRTNSTPGTPVNTISATVGTFTALGGVGGGAEFVAHKIYELTPNANLTIGALDVLEVTLTKVGSATTLANARAFVVIE